MIDYAEGLNENPVESEIFEFFPSQQENKGQLSTFNASHLMLFKPENKKSDSVGGLVSCHYYVNRNTPVDELVAELNAYDSLLAIGVVDDDGRAAGLIVRRELFNILGRNFGKDLIGQRVAAQIMKTVPMFKDHVPIYTVSDIIGDEIRSEVIEYYLVISQNQRFAGAFSTRDLLIYLAGITRKDIEMARLVQSSIVPVHFETERENFSAACCGRMAKGVGGDYYCCRKNVLGHWTLVIADASGKGVAASLITAVVGGIINTFDFRNNINDLISRLNDTILTLFQSEKFVTGVFIDMDPLTGKILLCDMGHSHIYIFRDRNVSILKTADKNPPIGIIEDIRPVQNTFKLEPGDLLFICTDGIIEQTGENREEFGINRTAAVILKNIDKNLSDIRENILNEVDSFRGPFPQRDDLTFMLLRYK